MKRKHEQNCITTPHYNQLVMFDSEWHAGYWISFEKPAEL